MRKRLPVRLKRSPGIVLGIALFALVTYLLGWSTLLAARSIEIDGTLRKTEITSYVLNSNSTFHLGQPLARVDVHSISRRLSQLDWVEKESVKRDWLHGRIKVTIEERLPVAQFMDQSGSIKLIDKNGKVFSVSRYEQLDKYPIIKFANNDAELLTAIAGFVQVLPSDLLANLESLAIRSPEFIQSVHSGLGNGHLIIRWGDNQEVTTKVKVLRTLLALPENAKSKLIDLSSPLSPIAK